MPRLTSFSVFQLLEDYRNWLIGLVPIALVTAFATFEFFTNYPAVVSRQGYYVDIVATILGCLAVTAALLPAAALLFPAKCSIAAAKVHAAIWAALVIINHITFEPGHSSPGDTFAVLYEIAFFGVLVFELVVIQVAVFRLSRADRESSSIPWLFTATTAALVGGWAAGVLVWSETVPPRVVEAAEKEAGNHPYCLEVVGRPAQSRRDLTGRSMHAPNDSGWTFQFHALLVVGEGSERAYSNWSYRSGRFEPVSDHARDGFHLDSEPRCAPVPHFARDLK